MKEIIIQAMLDGFLLNKATYIFQKLNTKDVKDKLLPAP